MGVFGKQGSCDTTFTWNMILQRINDAAHWRIEFKQFKEEMEGKPMDLEGVDSDLEDSTQMEETSSWYRVGEMIEITLVTSIETRGTCPER